MSDIVKRLRSEQNPGLAVRQQAADALERLTAENAALREKIANWEYSAKYDNELGWVIEGAWSSPSTPEYWAGSSAWTSDHMKALRFARREDAEQAAYLMCAGLNVRICEHAWVTNSSRGERSQPATPVTTTGDERLALLVDAPGIVAISDSIESMVNRFLSWDQRAELTALREERALIIQRAENAEAALVASDERRYFWQQQSEDRERWLKEREAELAAANALLREARAWIVEGKVDFNDALADRIDAHLARQP